ncbi:MAG: serine--tRNA ligase, partial [Candidatus Margulisiibacteriota bacterium]
MLDPKLIRNDPEKVKEALGMRRCDTSVLDDYLKRDEEWRKKLFDLEQKKRIINEVSGQIAKEKKEGKDASLKIKEMGQLSNEIKGLNTEVSNEEILVRIRLLNIPNIPDAGVPAGRESFENKVIRTRGEPQKFSFAAKSHDEIGEQLGILDFKRAAQLS